MTLLYSSQDVLPEHIIGGDNIDITINPHLTALHLFRLMQQKFGKGEIIQIPRKSFYKGVATVIELNKDFLETVWREWVYLYKRGNKYLELQYLILHKDDQPYLDMQHRSYDPEIILTSCSSVEIEIAESKSNLTNLVDRTFVIARQNVSNFILSETVGITQC